MVRIEQMTKSVFPTAIRPILKDSGTCVEFNIFNMQKD